MKDRDLTVDFLRALAMLSMFYLHTTALYLNRPGMGTIWDAGQFAVQLFVFCSGYILFLKTDDWQTLNLRDYWQFVKKRLIRLLVPYYIFLFCVFLSLYLFSPQLLSTNYLLQSIFLIGGIDIDWLVLLFVLLTLISPVLLWLKNRRHRLFTAYYLLSLFSSIILIFIRPKIDYRIYFWLPWSAAYLYPALLRKYNNKHKALFAVALCGATGLILAFAFFPSLGLSTGFYRHKYPPDLYYLVYGLIIINAVYLVPSFGRLKNGLAGRLVNFISTNSYPLFFIHWLVLYFLRLAKAHEIISWPLMLAAVVFLSTAIQAAARRIFFFRPIRRLS